MTGNKEKYKDIMSRGRSCRDVLWIFVFAIFWLGMYLLAAFAFSNGNPKRLLYGVDSFGNICGQNNAPVTGAPNSGLDMTSRRLLYYFTPDQSDSLRSCTELCPNVTCTGGGCTATDVFVMLFKSLAARSSNLRTNFFLDLCSSNSAASTRLTLLHP
eukprot:m.310652 g.310652  ORF g.310652 m.310652 type:complete len:157 (+) comp55355_c0_seq2:221-691(+)